MEIRLNLVIARGYFFIPSLLIILGSLIQNLLKMEFILTILIAASAAFFADENSSSEETETTTTTTEQTTTSSSIPDLAVAQKS